MIYENDHILIADKPAGVLSQKAEKTDFSLNEWLIGYLLEKKICQSQIFPFISPPSATASTVTQAAWYSAQKHFGARSF